MRIFVFNLLVLIGMAASTAATTAQSTSQARAISIADSLHEKAQYHYSQRNFAKAISDCKENLCIILFVTNSSIYFVLTAYLIKNIS